MAGRRKRSSADERRERRAEVDDPAVVMDAAAAFLAVRPRSTAETRRRLRHLRYPHAIVDQVVERLVDMAYLDDSSFARAWIESRDRSRPRGEIALRRELALKGVAREVIDEALGFRRRQTTDETTEDTAEETADMQAALRLLDRRRAALEREPDLRRRRQKAYALLARSGFDPETCRAAVVGLMTMVQ